MKFPKYRLRRLRKTESLRKLFSETKLSVSDLVIPYFVVEGKNVRQEIKSMPGVFRYSADELVKEVKEIHKLGILALILFGVPDKKDEKGSYAYKKDGVVQKAVRMLKETIPDLVVITDVCLCSYTTHGHCGVVKKSPQSTVDSPQLMVDGQRSAVHSLRSTVHSSRSTADDPRLMVHGQQKNCGLWTMDCGLSTVGRGLIIDNDATLDVLSKIALSHAEAGADIVAPSAMMDGQVQAIRKTLDENGFNDVAIMSYSAKYASSFYGPFREAADSSPKFGDRKTYQMNFCNIKEALREVEEDINEGADIVMVKPALAYLDVIRVVKEKFNIPVAAYNVSGEYSMVKAASEKGWINEKEVVLEILTSIKRAGADIIITYWAKDVVRWMTEGDG